MRKPVRHVLAARIGAYQNRLLMAHFAVVTFALVASFGVWQEAFQQHAFSLEFTAFVLLVVLGDLLCSVRDVPALLPIISSRASFIALFRESRAVSRITLEFLRCANRLAGAPPNIDVCAMQSLPQSWGSTLFHSVEPFFVFHAQSESNALTATKTNSLVVPVQLPGSFGLFRR